MKDFAMPKLGHLMEEGTVVAWKKKVGDKIAKGEIFLEVETDKGVLEAESDLNGTVKEFLVKEGTSVPVGTPIARIEEA